MAEQLRLVRFITNGILAQPLDRLEPVGVAICRPRAFVENEILTLSDERGLDGRFEVIDSFIDPGYSTVPRSLVPVGDGNYEIDEFFAYRRLPDFLDETLMGILPPCPRTAGICRRILQFCPLLTESYLYLGAYEWSRRRTGRAAKYLESAWKAAEASVPPRFRGHVCHLAGENRHIHAAASAHARMLLNAGRDIEAEQVMVSSLALDPCDGPGMLELLAPLLVRGGRADAARQLLDEGGVYGLNFWVLCLLELMGGRAAGAVLPLCRGAALNPWVPEAILDGARGRARRHPFEDLDRTPEGEAREHARELGRFWRKHGGFDFLRCMLTVEPFRRRLERLKEYGDGGAVEQGLDEVVHACRSAIC